MRPYDDAHQGRAVRFTLTAPEAEQVVLVGDFTDWETSKLELTDPDGDGVWEAKN